MRYFQMGLTEVAGVVRWSGQPLDVPEYWCPGTGRWEANAYFYSEIGLDRAMEDAKEITPEEAESVLTALGKTDGVS